MGTKEAPNVDGPIDAAVVSDCDEEDACDQQKSKAASDDLTECGDRLVDDDDDDVGNTVRAPTSSVAVPPPLPRCGRRMSDTVSSAAKSAPLTTGVG